MHLNGETFLNGKPFCLMRNTHLVKIYIENVFSGYLVKNTPYDFFAKL